MNQDELMNAPEVGDFYVHRTVLEALKAQFPPAYPRPDKDDREQLYKAGQHSVVQYLQRVFDQQQKS